MRMFLEWEKGKTELGIVLFSACMSFSQQETTEKVKRPIYQGQWLLIGS